MEKSADLGVLDILCLYSVNHRGRAEKPVDEYATFDSGSGKSNAASLSEVVLQLRLSSCLYDQPARSVTNF